MTEELWSVRLAAQLLDPAMTEREIRLMIGLLAIPSCGVGPADHGRPPKLYASADLMHAHALVMRTRSEFRK